METRISSFIEVYTEDGWKLYTKLLFPCHRKEKDVRQPFTEKNYNFFGWIADVKNYAAVKPFTKSRKLPENISTTVKKHLKEDAIHVHFLTSELLRVDFQQEIEDRRKLIYSKDDYTVEEGKGEFISLSSFLGEDIMNTINNIKHHFTSRRTLTRIILQFEEI